jgi:hypothetical protein
MGSILSQLYSSQVRRAKGPKRAFRPDESQAGPKCRPPFSSSHLEIHLLRKRYPSKERKKVFLLAFVWDWEEKSNNFWFSQRQTESQYKTQAINNKPYCLKWARRCRNKE